VASCMLTTTANTANTTSQEISDKKLGAVAQLARVATPVALADADPTAASRMQRASRRDGSSLSPDGRRRGSGTSSDWGVMVEEKGGSGDEREGRDGDRKRVRGLDVPSRN